MIRAIDEIFDSRIKTFLDFSFEPFSGTGVDRVRNQNTFVGYVKYGGMKVVLKSLDVTEKFGDLSFGGFLWCPCGTCIKFQLHRQAGAGKFD